MEDRKYEREWAYKIIPWIDVIDDVDDKNITTTHSRHLYKLKSKEDRQKAWKSAIEESKNYVPTEKEIKNIVNLHFLKIVSPMRLCGTSGSCVELTVADFLARGCRVSNLRLFGPPCDRFVRSSAWVWDEWAKQRSVRDHVLQPSRASSTRI